MIPHSSYYKWNNRKETANEALNHELSQIIYEYYLETKGILGYRRMTLWINKRCQTNYNVKRIRKLMKQMNLCSIIRRKRKGYIKSRPLITVEKYPEAIPLFHSDRGFQYTNKVFKIKLDRLRMTQSMSRVGRCIDNGLMESFWGTLKIEMYYIEKFYDKET